MEKMTRRDLIKKVLGIGGTAVLGEVMLSGCGDSAWVERQMAVLEKQGVLGEHPMVDLREISGFQASGNIGGGFLFLSGVIEGQTKTFVKFAWKTNEPSPRTFISTLPEEKVAFDVKPDAEMPQQNQPTVVFDFNFRGVYLHGTVESINPNDFIVGGGRNEFNHLKLDLATIRLSETEFRNWREPTC